MTFNWHSIFNLLMFKPKPLVFFGRAVDENLKQDIVESISFMLKPAKCEFRTFGDGEIFVRPLENVRDKSVFVVQPTNAPGDNIIELGIMLNAIRLASADKITAIIPYFGYSRQDKKTKQREPIVAKLMVDWIEIAGANRVVSVDFHAAQIQGFFSKLSDHLTAIGLFAQYLNENYEHNFLVVSPDAGGSQRAKQLSLHLRCSYVVASKERNYDDVDSINGITIDCRNIKDKIVIIPDDLTSSLSTLAVCAHAIKQYEPKKIIACVTHGLFADGSIDTLNSSPIDLLLTTNSTQKPILMKDKTDKLKIISLGPLLGMAITQLYLHKSISAIFSQKLPLKIY